MISYMNVQLTDASFVLVHHKSDQRQHDLGVPGEFRSISMTLHTFPFLGR